MQGPLTNGKKIEEQFLNALLPPYTTLMDIGPGIRPFDLVKYSTHLCVEPCLEYVEVLKNSRYLVFQGLGIEALKVLKGFNTIMLLDVLEHMSKREGKEVLRLAIETTESQIIVFTPLGFIEQSYKSGEKDEWGMNGGFWQTHRSGWKPDEFPGWKIFIDENYEKTHGAFIGVYTK